MPLPTKDQIQEALNAIDNLCAGPRTLALALQLLKKNNSGVTEIAELIECDHALALNVLRCANSAYYSRIGQVKNVTEAIQVIGFSETTRLVSLVVAEKTMNRPLWSYGISAGDYWSESLFNGLFLEALVTRIGKGDPGEAYITGLLRYVGRLAIDQVLESCSVSFSSDLAKSFHERELEIVGATQAQIGAQLLRKWNFPELLVTALEAQDTRNWSNGMDFLAKAMSFSAQVLPVGLSFATIMGAAETGIPCPDEHPFMVEYGLTVESVTAVFSSAYASFASIMQMLK